MIKTITHYDEFFSMKHALGKGFNDLPRKLQLQLLDSLTPDEILEFRQGHLFTTEILNKAQKIYNQWYKEEHPSNNELYERKMEGIRRSEISTMERQLRNSTNRLAELDKWVKLDKPLPIGERERLRKEIASLNSQLETHKSLGTKADSSEAEEDFTNKLI